MTIPDERYETYRIAVPAGLSLSRAADYVLRQTGKLHPCLEESCKADIVLKGFGKGTYAVVTVMHDAALLKVLAEKKHGGSLWVRKPYRHRVFRKGPVTQIHRNCNAGLAVVCAFSSAAVLAACMSGRPGIEEGADLVLEVDVEEDEMMVDEPVEMEVIEEVTDAPETPLLMPADSTVVGTIFEQDGSKTVFYRTSEGKLQTMKM